jgi:S1-C subfamily serine protease
MLFRCKPIIDRYIERGTMLRYHKEYNIIMLFIFIFPLVAVCMTESTNFAGNSISPEKKVAYLCSPAVVMVTFSQTVTLVNNQRTLLNEYGQGTVELTLANGSSKEFPIYDWYIGQMGSGFVISQDGYIITNDHVVTMSNDDLKKRLVEVIGKCILRNYPTVVNVNGIDYREIYKVLMNDYSLDRKNKRVTVYLGGTETISPQNGFSADVKAESPSWYDKKYGFQRMTDLAILKIDADNLPTATLGDSNKSDVTDKVIVIGYPGLVDSESMSILSEKTDSVPTVTTGIISAKKNRRYNRTVLQTDAAIEHGNSGGPAFNENGEVIGIATWGATDPNSGNSAQGYNFLIPLNEANDFIRNQGININTIRSETLDYFKKGLDYYWKQQYINAAQEFNKVLSANPNNYYAKEYLNMCNLK